MTTLLHLNPRSRNGDGECEAFVERLHQLGPVVLHRPDEGDLQTAMDAVGERLQRVVVGGGDGTLNRALPALVDSGVALGVLPLGTANDFARALGLPQDPLAALDAVLGGHTRRVGLGLANDHWFLNAAGIGLGPELTKQLEHERKQRLGVLAYLLSLFEVMGNRRRRRRAVLEADGTRLKVPFMQITIANGVHYGGGLTVARDVDLDDGQLHVLVLRPQTPFELMKKLFTLRFGSELGVSHEKMEVISSREVRIDTRKPSDVTLDGEILTRTPLECRCVPSALEVYAPRETATDAAPSSAASVA